MTQRTTAVNLLANVSNYVANMAVAENSTRKLGDTALATAVNQKAAAEKIGTAFLTMGAVAAAGVGLAIVEFAKFDAKMSELQGLSGASASEREALTQAALHDGLTLAFTANEVADAETQLVKAGLSVQQTIAALPGVLRLAAAAGIDTATATDLAAQAMLEFNLKASDIPHIADLLVAASDKTLTSVTDLAAGINTVAPVAHGLGISIGDVTGTLAAFSAAGLKGTAGASALQQTLLKLSSPTAAASKEMKTLGINVYDSNGQFIGLSGVAGQLQDKLGGLTTAQRAAAEAVLFGARATKGANVLYADGAAGIDAWNKKVNENGAAATQAAAKLNNLDGDLGKLQASFETDLIESGSGANDVLRTLTQGLTGLIGAVGSIPAPVLEVGLALGAVVAITGLVTGGFLTAVPKIIAFKAALVDLGVSGRVAAIGIGTVALVATALVAVLAVVAQSNADAAAKTEAYGETLDSVTHKTTAQTKALTAANLAQHIQILGFIDTGSSAIEIAKKYGVSLDLVTAAAGGNKQALKEFNDVTSTTVLNQGAAIKSQAAVTMGYEGASAEIQRLRQAVDDEANGVKSSIQVAKEKSEVDKTVAATSNDVGTSLDVVTNSANNANTAVTTLQTTLANYGKTQFDEISTQSDYYAAIDAGTAALKQNGVTLDVTTDKGRANQQALDDLASKTDAYTAALVGNGAPAAQVAAAAQAGYNAFVTLAEQMGLSSTAADLLADQLISIPSVAPHVTVTGLPQASSAIGTFISSWDGKQIRVNLDGSFTLPGGRRVFATGGQIPGTPSHKDNVVIGAATGEYVVNTRATQANKPVLDFINSGGKIRSVASVASVSRAAPSVGLPQGRSLGSGGSAVHNTYVSLTVQVPVSQSLIGNEDYLASKIQSTVKAGLKSGVLPANWNSN